ncbi:MAG: type II secretion system protein [Patescibacteria group bacterium]
MRNKKGFTLIELLVVIAIIGLLATIAVVALNSARTSSRDAKRIADVRQVQTGLELYYNAKSVYPVSATVVPVDSLDTLSTASGITTYLSGVDNVYDPSVAKASAACTLGETDRCNYGYTGTTTGYSIYFSTEAASGALGAGAHTGSDSGLI